MRRRASVRPLVPTRYITSAKLALPVKKMMMVKENLICMFGGVAGSEESLVNDLFLLNLSKWVGESV